MRDFIVKTLLSEAGNNQIEIQVRAQDFGMGDRGGVHVFDDTGKYVDLQLDCNQTVPNKYGPQDDVWSKRIGVSDLPAGMNVAKLRCTSFVKIDQADGSDYRVWEGEDHDIKTSPKNALLSVTENPGSSQLNHYSTKSTPLFSGSIEATSYVKGQMTGSHSVGYDYFLKSLKFTDTTGFFGGAPTLDVVIMPRLEHADRRGNGLPQLYVTREYTDLQQKNVITLTRQADGTYTAAAPANHAYMNAYEEVAYASYGDDRLFLGYELAVVDPASGKWDSNGGQNYLLPKQ